MFKDLTEDELELLHRYYGELVTLAKKDKDLSKSHSVEDARGEPQFACQHVVPIANRGIGEYAGWPAARHRGYLMAS